MATTTATIASQLDISEPTAGELADLTRVLAVAQEWAYNQVAEEHQSKASVQEAILLYAVRRYQSKQAPSGPIETDGFQSQGFTNFKDIANMLDPFRVWGQA